MANAMSGDFANIRRFVIMGVAGCGKSTVGAALARRVRATYLDGDDLHPASNIAKMSAGEPLSDADRTPWLDSVGKTLADARGVCIIGCSALRRAYRNRIRLAAIEPVAFLHLVGNREVIESRMQDRQRHFMPLSLLDSQFATLEPLQPDELGVSVDIDRSPQAIVEALRRALAD